MTRHRTTTIVALAIAAFGFGTFGTASTEGRAGGADRGQYKVIVHPRNPATWIAHGFLRDAYLKKELEWRDGQTILPVDLATRFPVREQFTHEVLNKTPAQLRSYWNQRIFSGKGAPPPEADVSAKVIAYVLANSGAIGYLPADLDPGGAKVIEVR
jgi:hypothetical protein